MSASSAFNNLAIDGDTLYTTYAYAPSGIGLATSGDIVAVPVSGGPARVVGAGESTSEWRVASFWVSAGQLHMQTGTDVLSIPADAATPSTLPVMLDSPAHRSAFAHDADYGYSALLDGDGLIVARTPIAGGAPTVIATGPAPSVGAMADAGDALLLHVGSSNLGEDGHVWRIPKDGTARGEPRPDVRWNDPVHEPLWLAWDGDAILGPTLVGQQNLFVQSRVAATGTSAPVQLKLSGAVATRRNDEILSLQMLQTRAGEPRFRLLVASSKGAPAGTVVACGSETISLSPDAPAGIAATDDAIYVSYGQDADTVIARVTP